MDSSGSVSLDESPPVSPIPPQPSSRRGLFFQGPEDPEPENPLHLVETAAADAGGSASDEWPAESPDLSEYADPTSSETSPAAGERPAQLLSRKQMRETAETAVKIGTGMAHTVAAKTQAQQQVGLYIADDDDAKAIGHPLADIMHRRGDLAGGKLSPDANSALQAVFGLVGYFTKQVQKVGIVRQLEAGQAAGEVQTFPTEGVA
jgi:hypothetical protein